MCEAFPMLRIALGVPVVVVQKETTISIDTMELHSSEQRDYAPFVSDFMTVCSHRHRDFWLRAGANGALVEVTGQPRFDIYAPLSDHHSPPLVVACCFSRTSWTLMRLELDSKGAGRRTWEPLRDATERVLLDGVRRGSCEVVIKCHPQQDRRTEADRLARRAGSTWNRGVSIAAPDADTRELIVAANVVVGFQTTALYEAVAARRSVVYAAWGEAYERHRDQLIRFDEAPTGCLEHADLAERLGSRSRQPDNPHRRAVRALVRRGSGCRRWPRHRAGRRPARGGRRRVAARCGTRRP